MKQSWLGSASAWPTALAHWWKNPETIAVEFSRPSDGVSPEKYRHGNEIEIKIPPRRCWHWRAKGESDVSGVL